MFVLDHIKFCISVLDVERVYCGLYPAPASVRSGWGGGWSRHSQQAGPATGGHFETRSDRKRRIPVCCRCLIQHGFTEIRTETQAAAACVGAGASLVPDWESQGLLKRAITVQCIGE